MKNRNPAHSIFSNLIVLFIVFYPNVYADDNLRSCRKEFEIGNWVAEISEHGWIILTQDDAPIVMGLLKLFTPTEEMPTEKSLSVSIIFKKYA